MICPDNDFDCDNPGCRRGGCQGRRPKLPLFRDSAAVSGSLPLLAAEIPGGAPALQAAGFSKEGASARPLVTA